MSVGHDDDVSELLMPQTANASSRPPRPPQQPQPRRTTLLPPPRLDHAARVYAGLATALVIPVTITMFIIVWAVQTLGPVDDRVPSAGQQSASAPPVTRVSPAFVVVPETPGKSTGEKIGGALLNTLIVVGAITVITFIMVVLYKYGYSKVLYVWLFLSAGLVFFLLSAIYVDLIATRFQIPYDFVMLGIVVWNFGVVGLLSVFYLGHPLMSQMYLIVISVIVTWGLTQTPEWTTWAILVGVAVYDIAAVLCPHGPLNLLVRAAQERQEPIPGFIYDSEAGPAFEMRQQQQQHHQPAAAPTTTDPAASLPSPTTTAAEPSAAAAAAAATRQARAENPFVEVDAAATSEATAGTEPDLDDLLGEGGGGAVVATAAAANANANAAANATATNNNAATKQKKDESDEEQEEDPFEAAHNASAFKLGLGDFIFYSLLCARAALTLSASQVPWLVSYICIIAGMGATLASLLFLRGKVPALPALPFSIFAATTAFFMTRYLTMPYWDFLTLHPFTP